MNRDLEVQKAKGIRTGKDSVKSLWDRLGLSHLEAKYEQYTDVATSG